MEPTSRDPDERRTTRRRARESALAELFSQEFGTSDSEWPRHLAELLDEDPGDYALALIEGITTHRDILDERIRAASHHWRIERMSLIDRNILRLAVYEILYVDDVPSTVAINEAVEIARRYGDTESFSFVNGVLDAIARESDGDEP